MSEPAAIRQLTTVLAFAYPFLAHLATFNFALAALADPDGLLLAGGIRPPEFPRHTLAAMPRLIGRVQ